MWDIEGIEVKSVSELLEQIKKDTNNWNFKTKGVRTWFRGQDSEEPPLPKLFREPGYDEFELTRMFRNRANAFEYSSLPETNRLDKWLFLMQHYGAPTRLLDWTESPLIALFFAICDYKNDKTKTPTIWVLHPERLNELSDFSYLPNTWTRKDVAIIDEKNLKIIKNINAGIEYFRLAFHPAGELLKKINTSIVKYPIAIPTVMLDNRMYSQQSCFTIHGIFEEDFCFIQKEYGNSDNPFLLKYIIEEDKIKNMFDNLRDLGINYTTIYPDLDGFSKELEYRFKEK